MVNFTINEELCKGCGLCVRACPKQILGLSKTKLNSKGYHPCENYYEWDCIACGSCFRTCPDLAIRIEKI